MHKQIYTEFSFSKSTETPAHFAIQSAHSKIILPPMRKGEISQTLFFDTNMHASKIAEVRKIFVEKILVLVQSNIYKDLNGIQKINALQLINALD